MNSGDIVAEIQLIIVFDPSGNEKTQWFVQDAIVLWAFSFTLHNNACEYDLHLYTPTDVLHRLIPSQYL